MRTFLKIMALVLIFSLPPALLQAQAKKDTISDPTGYLSLGARNSIGMFRSNGRSFTGTGAGGQFGIRIAKDFNSHYFADWIVSNIDNLAQRFDFHSGFSMMPEIVSLPLSTSRLSLFPLAGICIDYTKFSVTSGNNIAPGKKSFEERYSFAVQAGCGATLPVSRRLDFTVDVHYMLHIGTDVEIDIREGKDVLISKINGTNLEGHLFFAFSMDFKLFRLWRKK
jgi:hypothetical protein